MKNKKLLIILVAIILIILSMFIYRKVQSAYPDYIQIDPTTKKPIDISLSRFFYGSKDISAKTDDFATCINQTTNVVSCVSFCPGGDAYVSRLYCPPKDAKIYADKQDGKKYKDIIVTNHSYFFEYAMRRFFGFTQYAKSEKLISNTSKFAIKRIIAFMDDRNIKSSESVKVCNGAIKVEKALLGYTKTVNSNGSIAISKQKPAIYFYISRYVYPISKDAECIDFGIPMDIVEPIITDTIKKKLPAGFDVDNFNYYFMDIKNYPKN